MAKDPSKTEEATPKRVNKARGEGNVAKSQELTKLATNVAGLVGLSIWIGYISLHMQGIYKYFMTESVNFTVNEANLEAMALWLIAEISKMVLPIILFIAVVTFVCLRVQVGKLWTTKVFKFKLSRFNPVAGLKRMLFSLQTFVRLGKSLLQSIVIGIAPWIVIKKEIELGHFQTLYYEEAAGVAIYMLSMAYKIVIYALIPSIAIAVFDFWWTRREYRENLKMSKDEVKDERKQQEGDPLVKGQMRQKMMGMVTRQMMKDVPKADVIITNPTHIAVALSYNPKEFPAPIIVAMGANKVAERIKAIAKEHHVPIRENKPLARALYKQADVGDMIPEDLFQAVAAILAQIWKMKPKK